ncbi:uncharacterized protein PAC_02805 [Phialocephala subalpina]|uniref:Uncharacterized protein n=1 Tax=Phialocephala subalpina TaxID=576137 RepID=A0A1L7WJH8_9HELO|nr:uncharacterized protein PAC_02805 [Phialocephala subalpina]
MATMTSSGGKLVAFLKLVSNQQAMLYFLANPTTVNKIRLDAGIKGDLESKEFALVCVRRSNRIKSSAQKRKFDNLKGMASPCKRKRKTSKPPTTPVNEDTTVNDKSSADVDTEVGTPSAVDEPGVEVAAEDAAAEDAAVGTPAAVDEPGVEVAAEDAAVGTPAAVDVPGTDAAAEDAAAEDAAVGTPAAVDVPGTDATAEDTAVGTPPGHIESVSSEVMTDSLQSSSQSTPLRPRTPGSITDNSSPESSSTTENAQMGVRPNPLHPEHANRVATSVLLEVVNQHDKIGQFGGRTEKATITTNTAKIRAFTKELASLEYKAAVYSIKERNAMHAANGIQIGNDENAYWEIILKGVKALDPATLPKGAPKGPLDDFSAAEKIATYNFMKHAHFKTSPENQRQCRGFWKTLFDTRKAGVEMITCYRTAEFNQFCKTYPRRSDISLVDTIVSWEKVYGPQIDQLEGRDETGPCESWRVLVIASKAIMPFEPLVRAAPRNEQYLLHQALGFAKRGFMKSTLVTKLKA